jgi:RHS repeat-associated protein
MTIDDFKGISLFFDGSLAKKYIYGPGMDSPAAMINVSGVSETWYYYYADALGSIRLMSNAGGAIVESYAYDVFGRPRVMTSAGADGNWLTEDVATYNYSSIGNPYLFTGRRWDSVAGLYYYRFRDFSPDLGRFLQPDPLGYIDGMNLYAYVNNNPLNWIDPWGLCKGEGGNPNWTWDWGGFAKYTIVGTGLGALGGVVWGGVGALPGAGGGFILGAASYAGDQIWEGVTGDLRNGNYAPMGDYPLSWPSDGSFIPDIGFGEYKDIQRHLKEI